VIRAVVRFFSSGPSLLGLVLVALFIGTALAAPTLAPDYGALEAPPGFQRAGRALDRTPHPPSAAAPLGTLPGQWDVYFTIVWGTRAALRFGLSVAAGAAILGTLVGLLSGYAGGWIHRLTMAVVDGFLTFPALAGFFLVERVLSTLPERGARLVAAVHGDPLMLTLIAFSWMPYARIIASSTLRTKRVDYVEASRALGARWTRVAFCHLLPNVVSPAFVLMARDIGAMVILSAAFTFIGVGSSSPWGMLVTLGRDWIIGPGGNPFFFWWVYVPATLALLLFGIGWNLTGDGLADLLLVRQHVVGAAALASKSRRRAWAVPVSAATMGVLLGLLWTWWANPSPPSGLTPDALREEQRAQYLRMSIEAFSRDLDIDQAMRRYQSLGRHAEDTLHALRLLNTSPPQRAVRQFAMVVQQLARFYPFDAQASPPSLGAILILLIPAASLVVFVLALPAAIQELAGHRLMRRQSTGASPLAGRRV
jgi:peptide/nickel transport system permease protein